MFVGLKLILGKSAFLVKGMWEQRHLDTLRTFGIQVKQKVQYVGVLVGRVSSEEAYAPLIARALHRAHYMRTLPLTHDECIALFLEWVLPLFIFPAWAYFPTDSVVAKLANVYKVALRLNSWGLTLPILAHAPAQGGNNHPSPAPSSCGSTQRHL